MTILLVEDNSTICKGLKYTFKKSSYNLLTAENIAMAKTILASQNVDLIILDVLLPDGNGFNFFSEIQSLKIPVLFLTARDEEDEIVKGLDMGAEDYITKPFSTKELLARINKILARTQNNNIIKVQNLTFDLAKMEVKKHNKIVELTALELKILNLLFLNINNVVSRQTIIEKIWEWTGNDVDDHTVTVYINRLREKIGSEVIITLKGIGYRIDEK